MDPGGRRLLEPCAGNGAIVRAVEGRYPGLYTWELVERDMEMCRDLREYQQHNPAKVVVTMHGNFLRHYDDDGRTGAVIMNPPYSWAEEFVRRCLEITPRVAALLRLNFLGGKSRRDWLSETRPSVYVLPNRPSFRVDGRTDATEYAWFVWDDRTVGGQWEVLALTADEER